MSLNHEGELEPTINWTKRIKDAVDILNERIDCLETVIERLEEDIKSINREVY